MERDVKVCFKVYQNVSCTIYVILMRLKLHVWVTFINSTRVVAQQCCEFSQPFSSAAKALTLLAYLPHMTAWLNGDLISLECGYVRGREGGRERGREGGRRGGGRGLEGGKKPVLPKHVSSWERDRHFNRGTGWPTIPFLPL